jgi:hypothetical protein
MLFKSVLLSALALFASNVRAEVNGAEDIDEAEANVIVPLTLDADWTLFRFGNGGTNVSTIFQVNATAFSLQLTDLYFVGDSFAYYVNDNYLGSTCMVNPDMMLSTTDADYAYSRNPYLWSRGCMFVAPGPTLNNITIHMNQSPFTGGIAAIRVVSDILDCPNICRPDVNYTDLLQP